MSSKLPALLIIILLIYELKNVDCQDPLSEPTTDASSRIPKTSTDPDSGDEMVTSESNRYSSFPRPFSFGAEMQSEILRLKSLEDVFPPPNISYYKPYADRTVVLLKFPVISPTAFIFSTLDKDGYSPRTNCSYTIPQPHIISEAVEAPYGLPDETYGDYGLPPPTIIKYGPPPPLTYGRIPNPEEKADAGQPPDVGVIVTQSYILRENVRDYLNITGFMKGKPSNDLLSEMAKALGNKNFEAKLKEDNFRPPLSAFYYLYQPRPFRLPAGPSFVLLHLESYLKTSNDSRRFGFVNGKSFSNGTIYFPREKNPELMARIPFVLRPNGEIDYVFEYEGQGGRQDLGTLLKAKSEIRSFVKLVHEIQNEVHKDGKGALERAIKGSEKLQKPRFIQTTADDPTMAAREAEARNSNWLYTSSIGIRSITYPKARIEKEVVLLDPLLLKVQDPHLHHLIQPSDHNPHLSPLPE